MPPAPAAATPEPSANGSFWRALVRRLRRRDKNELVREAIEEGVLGYVHADCPVEVLVDAVRCLEIGQRFLCRTAATRMAEGVCRQRLTARESDVMRLLCAGMNNKAIGRQLNMALGTVKTHVRSILDKLEAHSRTQVVVKAQLEGWGNATPGHGASYKARPRPDAMG